MDKLVDKLFLFLFGSFLCYVTAQSIYVIFYILLAVSLSSLLTTQKNSSIRMLLFGAYWVACFLEFAFLAFLPLVLYDSSATYQNSLLLVPLLFQYSQFSFIQLMMLLSFLAMYWILKQKTTRYYALKQDHIQLRDLNKEFMLQLEQKNTMLLERQEFEIHVATLRERNRIAREIHDHVGHRLTSAILQIGALLITSADHDKEPLQAVKTTLDAAMDSIRSSVHNLHDASIDLEQELSKLSAEFKHCPIDLRYHIQSTVPHEVKLALLAITKEALTNIAKHSDASQCILSFQEHPHLFQCKIKDNGTKASIKQGFGIGLQSIQERVQRLNGYIQITVEQGFQIFITIPKEETYASSYN